MEKDRKLLRLSPTSVLHYVKLVYRSCLLLAALILYLINRITGSGKLFGGVENDPVILVIIWLVFAVEMIFRFFPIRLESMGCRKQFASNYKPVPGAVKRPEGLHRGVLLTAVCWVALNGILGGLYYAGVIDAGILLLISLAYSVCDMICILFFCPFQSWFMKNKCCTTCRIYNWDYAMMFTPLIFVPNGYTWTLLALGLALLIQWEVLVKRRPERFSEATNCALRCANCTEKLCHHKTQLRRLWERERARLQRMGREILRREGEEK